MRNCSCGSMAERFDMLLDVEPPPLDSGSEAGTTVTQRSPSAGQTALCEIVPWRSYGH